MTLQPSPEAIAEVWAVSLAHELGIADLPSVRRHLRDGTTDSSCESILRIARAISMDQTPNEADIQAVGPETIAKLRQVIQPIGS